MKSQTLLKIFFSGAIGCVAIFFALVWYASRTIEQKADAGDSEAQYLLALKLIDQSNFDEAITWIRKAADDGHVPAQVILGGFYLSGKGTEPDPVRARHWFELAANDNHPSALIRLGEIYRDGFGLPVNFDKAMFYFEKAAENGSLDGKYSLAELALARAGKYRTKGVDLLISLAESGQVRAMETLAQYYSSHRNYGHSCDWHEKAAKTQHAMSIFKLAMCYHDGLGRKKDLAMFFQYVSAAANLGLADAQLVTGDAYALGMGTEPEPSLAIDWYQKAADQDSPQARYKLAKILLNSGEAAAAEAQLVRSAAKDFAPAQYELGLLLKQRNDSNHWEQIALLFEKSARSGYPQAQFELGQLYATGQGLVLDFEQARYWFNKAIASGNLDAKKALGNLSNRMAMPAH
jgi:TPR repeat protein